MRDQRNIRRRHRVVAQFVGAHPRQLLAEMRRAGSQVVLATHSPVLAALPGARLLQFGEDGVTAVDYDESELVTSWRAFLDTPARHLRHLT